MKSFVAFLLGILLTVASFGLYQFYIIQKGDDTPVTPDINPTAPLTTEPTVTAAVTPISHCTTEEIVGTGYTFCAPADHNITKNTLPDNSKKFIFISRTTGDTITIDEKLKSTSYTDSDSKFGDVKVAYNAQKNMWEATGECDSPSPCNRSFVNGNGVQVFIGRSRWLTYIAPLGNAEILIFNSTGGGYTKPLEDLIQTVKAVK